MKMHLSGGRWEEGSKKEETYVHLCQADQVNAWHKLAQYCNCPSIKNKQKKPNTHIMNKNYVLSVKKIYLSYIG